MAKRRKSGEVSVYLGPDSGLDGLMTFKGQARIDGPFQGEIKGTGTLIVGPQARVEARVEATCVEVSGEIIGDVEATERIELHSPGKLRGNITAPLVVMDEGVLFEGHCRMAAAEDGSMRMPKVRLLAADGTAKG